MWRTKLGLIVTWQVVWYDSLPRARQVLQVPVSTGTCGGSRLNWAQLQIWTLQMTWSWWVTQLIRYKFWIGSKLNESHWTSYQHGESRVAWQRKINGLPVECMDTFCYRPTQRCNNLEILPHNKKLRQTLDIALKILSRSSHFTDRLWHNKSDLRSVPPRFGPCDIQFVS